MFNTCHKGLVIRWCDDKAARWHASNDWDPPPIYPSNMWMCHPETVRQLHFCAVLLPQLSFYITISLLTGLFPLSYYIPSFFSDWLRVVWKYPKTSPLGVSLIAMKVADLGPLGRVPGCYWNWQGSCRGSSSNEDHSWSPKRIYQTIQVYISIYTVLYHAYHISKTTNNQGIMYYPI